MYAADCSGSKDLSSYSAIKYEGSTRLMSEPTVPNQGEAVEALIKVKEKVPEKPKKEFFNKVEKKLPQLKKEKGNH